MMKKYGSLEALYRKKTLYAQTPLDLESYKTFPMQRWDSNEFFHCFTKLLNFYIPYHSLNASEELQYIKYLK